MDLIDKWIFRIADYSVDNNPQSPPKDVIIFVFRLLFNVGLTILLTLIIGACTGHLGDACIVILSTMLLKIFTGSLHFHSILWCVLYSSGVMTVLSHFPVTDGRLVILLSVVTMIPIFLYAPKNITVFFKLKPDQIQHLKWVALFLVAFNMFVQVPLATGTFLFQAISITPFFEKLFTLAERRKNA